MICAPVRSRMSRSLAPVGSSIAIRSPGRAVVWQSSWTPSYPPPTASQPRAGKGQSGSTAARRRGVIVSRA